MDLLREFLDAVKEAGAAEGHFRGLLHLLIGQPIRLADGTLVSAGMTWRAVATVLKKNRWDREVVRELGLDPSKLPPRDREKFWYAAITLAVVNSPQAQASAQAIAQKMLPLGYRVGATSEAGKESAPAENG